MSDKIDKSAEIANLMDELFDSKPKNIKGLKDVYQIQKPTIKDKKETTKIMHDNNPSSGGTVIHGENTQVVHNHKGLDYKVDNTAIDNGRASIGLRVRGERVEPKHMSPREYENFLYYTFKIPGKKGWNGIERSDFAQNWEPDESQSIKTKEEALAYLKIKASKKSPDGIEKRTSTRRTGKKDIRKNKQERRLSAKERRREDINNHITYFINVFILFIVLVSWGFYSVYLYIEGLK